MISVNKKLNIHSKNLMSVIHHLNSSGQEARIVGGVVRDSLIGIPVSDIDIITSLVPDRVVDLLSECGIKIIKTGIKFGTVIAVINDESFEITTLRQDLSCDGRYAMVKYSNNFAEDAKRRDFSINALSYCPINHKIYDYFSGLEDLKNRRVVFIGNARDRVQEDYLRILRFFRFSARYAKEIDVSGLEVCIEFKRHLAHLSMERIKSEMDIILRTNHYKTIDIMFKCGILNEILPIKQYIPSLHARAISLCNKFNAIPTLPLIYSVLFIENKQLTYTELIRLKFSKIHAKIIIKMCELQQIVDDYVMIHHLKNIWLEEKDFVEYFIFASLLITKSDAIIDLYSSLEKRINKPVFPVSSYDISSLGYSGKSMGKVLRVLRQKWIDSDFSYDRAILLDIILHEKI